MKSRQHFVGKGYSNLFKSVQQWNQQTELLSIFDRTVQKQFSNCICVSKYRYLYWGLQYCTFDRQLHSAVHVTQGTLAALHSLVSGRWGLTGQRTLLINLKAAFLVHQRAAVDRQRRETLVAHAAIACYTWAAFTHTLVLLFDQGLQLLLCKGFRKKTWLVNN